MPISHGIMFRIPLLCLIFIRMVDEEIISILRQRYEDCCWYNHQDREMCADIYKTYQDATTAFFTKCK